MLLTSILSPAARQLQRSQHHEYGDLESVLPHSPSQGFLHFPQSRSTGLHQDCGPWLCRGF